jgi:hypothetical protein
MCYYCAANVFTNSIHSQDGRNDGRKSDDQSSWAATSMLTLDLAVGVIIGFIFGMGFILIAFDMRPNYLS